MTGFPSRVFADVVFNLYREVANFYLENTQAKVWLYYDPQSLHLQQCLYKLAATPDTVKYISLSPYPGIHIYREGTRKTGFNMGELKDFLTSLEQLGGR